MKNKDSDLVLIGFIDPGTSAVRRATHEETESHQATDSNVFGLDPVKLEKAFAAKTRLDQMTEN